MLIVALDANFRLSNLRRLSSADPGLHTGMAYFCGLADYYNWLAKHTTQHDVSILLPFAFVSSTDYVLSRLVLAAVLKR